MQLILAIFCSYLLGSIPTAFIFGKLYKNIDIRLHGSKNIGATNVFRVLGKGPGIIVLVLDIIKGTLAILLIAQFFKIKMISQIILLAVAVVSGHNWTIFLKFKGGKGVATSLGVLIGLAVKISVLRPVLIFTLVMFILTFLLTSIVSLSSLVAAISMPIIMLISNQDFELIFLGAIFSIFVVIRHRPNIKRLLSGQESKVPLFRKKEQK